MKLPFHLPSSANMKTAVAQCLYSHVPSWRAKLQPRFTNILRILLIIMQKLCQSAVEVT